MGMSKFCQRASLVLFLVVILGFMLSCARKQAAQVPSIRETASQWNAAVNKHIPDAERAGRLKQLGLQLIELQDSLTDDITVLNAKAVALNANYDATKEEARQLFTTFFEKRNAVLAQYRDVVFAMRREVSAEEWKALTN